jgi:hypothetical protein
MEIKVDEVRVDMMGIAGTCGAIESAGNELPLSTSAQPRS